MLLDFKCYERIRNLTGCVSLKNRTILDIGCGSGQFGIIYILMGARNYLGCDYKLKMDEMISLKNPLNGETVVTCTTPRMLTQLRDQKIQLFHSGWESLSIDEKNPDIIVLNLVTEHLMEIEEAFNNFAKILRDGGKIIFLHHNFYSWNGHHQEPKSLKDIDHGSEEQKKWIDWNHISYNAHPEEYVSTKLNRIKLDELKKLTEKYFKILIWQENSVDNEILEKRYSSKILKKFPDLSKRDLTVKTAYCVAMKAK